MHVFVIVQETLQDVVRDMLVRNDLPVFMESFPRPTLRVQPDVGILSGLQLGHVENFVADRAPGAGGTIGIFYQPQSRCSPVAGAVVYGLSLLLPN